YVTARDNGSAMASSFLARAVAAYQRGYEIAPAAHHWHAVNMAALTMAALRDGGTPAGLPDAGDLARAVLARLDERRRDDPVSVERPYDLACRLEAWLVLGEPRRAQHEALDYVSHPET